jgi:hypothetical protein
LEVVWFKVQVWVKTLKGVCYVRQLKVRVILGQFSVLSVFLLSLLSLAFVLGSDIKKNAKSDTIQAKSDSDFVAKFYIV